MPDTMDTPDILKKILARKAEEVAARKRKLGLDDLTKAVAAADPVRGFMVSLQEKIHTGKAAVIAEIKKASPSRGVLREAFEPQQIAVSYE